MRKLSLGSGALVGGLLTAPLMGLMYLANQLVDSPFPPFDFFNWIARVLPGPIITFGIDAMIDTLLFVGLDVADTAKTAERAIAIIQFLVIGLIIGALFFAIMRIRQQQGDYISGLILGALWGLPVIAITITISQAGMLPFLSILWLLFLFLVWGLLVNMAYGRLHPPPASAATEKSAVVTLNRRQFLIKLGASTATITVLSGGTGLLLSGRARQEAEAVLAATDAHNADGTSRFPFPNANDPVVPVPGTRPEYTPLKDHYQVFLQTEPTIIEEADWVLPITGLVANPLMLTRRDIVNNYESFDQYVTLNCISGRIGTTLISTTQWTGVSVQDILADAGVSPNARYLYITSGDGFYETVDLELINNDRRIMFCHSWDGQPLPKDHGFPLRIWIPDRFGMKQPKWITGVEVTDEYKEGYWVERGWSELAQVKTTSVIDTVALDSIIEQGGQRLVPVGGIAFSGDRQISRVEVRVDGGPWQAAQLRSPLSETTWVIWRYEWPFVEGNHTFEVRCAEGDGTPQIEEAQDNRPDGATGIHTVEVSM
jgi:DMSO/TMAO reductase YedYZ molybdopterin-dependent catalytic subunit